MALTTEQEEKVAQIIEAFENGKRLSDLPNVSGTNPYNLFCEVLDEDGESKKAALATLLPYTEEQSSYGVQFDTAVSTPTCTRIGSSDLHKSCPVQNRMRGCLLDDDGNVVEYLDPRDWTGQVRDGSRGQVMVEIPLHYRKFETDGTKLTASCQITVRNKELNVTPAKLTLVKGKYRTLKVTGAPAVTTKNVKFYTMNSRIATVSSTGRIYARNVGTCKIKVVGNGLTKYVTLTVKAR